MTGEQFFYGRGSEGYAILGASVPSCGLTDQVLELCQSVGTPGFEREDDDQPFLLQKACGPNVLMACGRNGEPDSLGRKTLFFHVVAVPLSFAKEKWISAADLYRAGLFSEKCRDGKLSALPLDHVSAASGVCETVKLKFPAVFHCRRAESLRLVKLMGGSLVCTNWTTMSWCVLKGFDWYGLDESRSVASIPAEFAVYDGEGRRLRGDDVGGNVGVASCADVRGRQALMQVQKGAGMKTCVLVGFVALLMGLGLGWRLWGNVESQDDEALRARLRAEVEADLRKKFDGELQEALKARTQAVTAMPRFDGTNVIRDFKKEMQADQTYVNAFGKNKDDLGRKPLRDLFGKLEYYVVFVNENFCNEGNKKKEEK